MTHFIEIPASKKSIAFRRPVHGMGINDADYMVCPKVNGKNSFCPYYKVWMNMVSRAYNPKYHKTRPTYSSCTVSPEWLYFSNFKRWMVDKDWSGKHLDKDLLMPGNKAYGPEFCTFVTSKVNSLLSDHGSARGLYPQGVFFESDSGRYRARCSVNGKQTCLGRFEFSFQAELAYLEFKSKLVESVARTEGGLIESGLLRHAKIMKARIKDIKQEYTYQS